MADSVEGQEPKRENILMEVFPGVARIRLEVNNKIFTLPSPASIIQKANVIAHRHLSKAPDTGRACLQASHVLAELIQKGEMYLHRAAYEMDRGDTHQAREWIKTARVLFEEASNYWNKRISDELRDVLKI